MKRFLPYIIFSLLLLALAANGDARAAPVAVPKKGLEIYCNERIGVMCFISAAEDVSCVPLKDTKVKSCKDVP